MDLDEMIRAPWFREAAERDEAARRFVEKFEPREPEPEAASPRRGDPFVAYLRSKVEAEFDARWSAYVQAVNERCAERRCPELAGVLILEVTRGLPLDGLEARISALAEPKPSAPGRDLFNHQPSPEIWRAPDSRPLLSKLGFDPSKPGCKVCKPRHRGTH